jgi:hypothetical protein
MTQVIDILSPFLAFVWAYIQTKAHNMFAIMLDLGFKNMKVVWDFVGNDMSFELL